MIQQCLKCTNEIRKSVKKMYELLELTFYFLEVKQTLEA